jgi:putative SOS response-associated peptidase YedK
MAGIHDRMPVIVRQQDYERWLNPKYPSDDLKSLLTPFPDELEAYPVSTHVNSPKNDDPMCIEKLK